MMSVRLQSFLIVAFFSETMAQLSFVTPPPGGATVSFPENQAVGTTLYNIQADNPAGNPPIYTVLSSTCESPAPSPTPQVTIFPIINSDRLVVSTGGLDAENCSHYTFTFRVRAGTSTQDSGPLTIMVTDINDNPPTFDKSSYNGNVWKNDGQGQIVNDEHIIATDPDVSKLPVTLSISGAQTTFAIYQNGSVYVDDSSGLAPLASPTVLTIQASDGVLTSTAPLAIIIHADPCTSSPCQNGGTCTSTRFNHSCSCLPGYTGDKCQNVNYCLVNPCNDGTCINQPTNYSCDCTGTCFSGINCTVRDQTCTSSTGTSPPPFPDSSTTTPYQNDSTSTSTIPPPMPCTRKWPFWIIAPVVCVFIIIGFIIWQCLDEQEPPTPSCREHPTPPCRGKRNFMIIAPIVFVLMNVGITMWICFG